MRRPSRSAARSTTARGCICGSRAARPASPRWRRELGGEAEPLGFWDAVRDHAHPALAGEAPLWRLSLPQTAPIPAVGDVVAWDWAGAQVWLRSDAAGRGDLAGRGRGGGGHATLFRGAAPGDEVFQPLAPAMLALHQRLKSGARPGRRAQSRPHVRSALGCARQLAGPLADTVAGARAEAVIRACVHCGMCNAVCPTFQLTGDELDGPRGRIYLMKGALEGEAVGRRDPAAPRPLPGMPRLRDRLPVRRRVPPPARRRPTVRRGESRPAVARARAADAAALGVERCRAVRGGARVGASVRLGAAERLEEQAAEGRPRSPDQVRGSLPPRGGDRRGGGVGGTDGAARRLRAGGRGAAVQRGGQAGVCEAGCRAGREPARRLLRGGELPPRCARGSQGAGAAQYRRLDGRARRRGGRGGGHRQRLRGLHQGLSRPAGRRSGLCREGAADRGLGARPGGGAGRRSRRRPRMRPPSRGSPSTTPARCAMA